MTVYIPKVVTRPKMKSQRFRGVIVLTGNGLMGSFILQYNPDLFLWYQCKNEWRGLLSHVKWCLSIFGGNCICGQKWVVLLAGFCTCSKQKKNAKLVARACPIFHWSGWLVLLQPRPQSIELLIVAGAGRTCLGQEVPKFRLTEDFDCEGSERNHHGQDSWIGRWLAQMFVMLRAHKRQAFWVTTIEMSSLRYFWSFWKFWIDIVCICIKINVWSTDKTYGYTGYIPQTKLKYMKFFTKKRFYLFFS